jgi:hypothetical protein
MYTLVAISIIIKASASVGARQQVNNQTTYSRVERSKSEWSKFKSNLGLIVCFR